MNNFNTDTKDKIPPHNLEAEANVLGSVLIDPEAINKIADSINEDDFYKTAHRIIFKACISLYDKREPIDLLSVSNILTEENELENIGGKTYLASLSNSVVTASNVKYYAEIVQKKATLRRLIKASSEITSLAYNETENVDNVLDESEQKLFGISQKFLKQNFIAISSVLHDTFDRIDELHKNKGKLRGIPTGYVDLDNLLAGFQKSNLIIIAARPSVGKTSFALDIARHVATKNKECVGLFSLEMSKEELVDRILCAEAGVSLWKMRTGRLSDRDEHDDFPRIGNAMGTLAESKIFIDDSGSLNIMQIRTKARRLKLEHNLSLLIVDYLQLMESKANAESRVQEVAEITRGLKTIARELNIPIIALSQLSRAVEQFKPAIPKLAHLRESGSIEQDADVVMFIYRKAADRSYRFEDLTPEEKCTAEIHIAKHRNGPTGMVRLFFDQETVSFKSLEKGSSVPPPSQEY
ncbi:MAG: replicative DNA helicase [Patescibacteria group bacterium]|nr:replicative DNA helicase [Patescibacteria group bacterium]MDD4304642.1 replicative DNA helicase [Patescibacteria group bacterium]MDD4695569.1 replicative DNA helicase [Patescibacteria group bacterium]